MALLWFPTFFRASVHALTSVDHSASLCSLFPTPWALATLLPTSQFQNANARFGLLRRTPKGVLFSYEQNKRKCLPCWVGISFMARCKRCIRFAYAVLDDRSPCEQYPSSHFDPKKQCPTLFFLTGLALSEFESLLNILNKKNTLPIGKVFFLLARCKRFELLAFWSVAKRSIQLS